MGGLIASIVLLFLSSLTLQLLGSISAFFSSHYAVFYDADSLLTVVGAACLVYLCAQMKIGANPIINKISSATFSVFLIHAHIGVRYWIWNGLFKTADYTGSPWLVMHMILCVLAVYAACTAIDLLRQQFIEKPFMGFVDRIIDNWTEKLSKNTRSN